MSQQVLGALFHELHGQQCESMKHELTVIPCDLCSTVHKFIEGQSECGSCTRHSDQYSGGHCLARIYLPFREDVIKSSCVWHDLGRGTLRFSTCLGLPG